MSGKVAGLRARLEAAERERDANRRAADDARERERAVAELLGVITHAATDLQRVFDTITQLAMRLTDSNTAFVNRLQDGEVGIVAGAGVRYATNLASRESPIEWGAETASMHVRILHDRATTHLHGGPEAFADEFPELAGVFAASGMNSGFAVPLFVRDMPWGTLSVARASAAPYLPEQITLLETFAIQAALAIETARTQQQLAERNDDLGRALEQQAATAGVLESISRFGFDLDDVLNTVVQQAAVMLRGRAAIIFQVQDDWVVQTAVYAPSQEVRDAIRSIRVRTSDDDLQAIVIREQRARSTTIRSGNPGRSVQEATFRRLFGGFSTHMVPMSGKGSVIGGLAVLIPGEHRFTAEESALIQTFSNHAAIAIENARLIHELRESNRVVSENLDIQRVMGNVLSIVASAPTDLQATLPQIALAANQLCDARSSTVHWIDGDQLHAFNGGNSRVATRPYDPDWARTSMMGAAALGNRVIELACSVAELAEHYPYTANIWRNGPDRAAQDCSGLAMPMQGQGGSFGAISVWRRDRTPFTERQRTVLRALANQAVVAIENSRLFNQLQTKTQELEVASRHKSEFLANMSHELRTPLNAIIGYAELLQEECQDLGQQDFLPDLGKIHTAGNHLLTLISGILDLSKVEAGRMTLYLEDFDVATLVRDAESIVRPLVEKNHNEFVIDCPADIGVMRADLVKVRQVLFNLLSNSAKFTEGGAITLTVRKRPADDTVDFAIRDTGIGMTEEQLGRLFEAFSQANAETSRKYGGTGLGLALSREFCRMMGGDINVRSELGAGSTFTMTLPITCIDPAASA